MPLRAVLVLITVLTILLITTGCNSPTRPKEQPDKQLLPIPKHGATMLPDSPNLNTEPSVAAKIIQDHPRPSPAYRLLKDYAENHPDHPYVAITGVWNPKIKQYRYHSIPLSFPDSVKPANITPDSLGYYQYRLTRNHSQAWRILVGLIPPTDGARKQMDRWLQYPDRSKVDLLIRGGTDSYSSSTKQKGAGATFALIAPRVVTYPDGTSCLWWDGGGFSGALLPLRPKHRMEILVVEGEQVDQRTGPLNPEAAAGRGPLIREARALTRASAVARPTVAGTIKMAVTRIAISRCLCRWRIN